MKFYKRKSIEKILMSEADNHPIFTGKTGIIYFRVRLPDGPDPYMMTDDKLREEFDVRNKQK